MVNSIFSRSLNAASQIRFYYSSIRFILFQAHKITNLRPHTSYHIGLSVFNPEGFGPNTTLLIRTDEGSKYYLKQFTCME